MQAMLVQLGMMINIPNFITISRIFLTPVIIWLLLANQMMAGFLLFLLAGISDGLDGWLAKRFGWQTELGAFLDAVADKMLLVSIYIALGINDYLPLWLVIAVVARDILIISAVVLSWMLDKPMPIHPLYVSKANTVAQIALAALVMAAAGLGFQAGIVEPALIIITGLLTIISAGAYLMAWLDHMTDPFVNHHEG